MGGHLDAARAAYERRAWTIALDGFAAAHREEPLRGDDLYAYANAHWWLGRLDDALALLETAHRALLDEGRPRAAALVALDTGYTFALRGEDAQASGWFARAERLLDGEGDCAEQGYLLYCAAEDACGAGRLDEAAAVTAQVRDLGRRFDDRCLLALAALIDGRVRIKQGSVREGLALLDEAMVAAVADDLDPGWAGNIYCNLMLACFELADWARADEWTGVTARWCEAMPGAGPFMGICRVHRAQVLRLRGDWQGAETEVRRVRDELGHFHVGMVGEATYQLAELHRQRGALSDADAGYADARRLGRDPQPGLALLRLAQGRPSSAAAMVSRSLDRTSEALARAQLLPAAAEIFAAAGDLDRARSAADELDELAVDYGTAGLAALAATARGTVELAAGDPAASITPLRSAVDRWSRIGARHDAAEARRLLARCLRLLGDDDEAALEDDAATAELDALRAGARGEAARRADGLTAREVEVLRHVADGRSNREIADELFLSVRTVERHLATAYQKLGLRGRAARASAVRHLLVGESTT